jgi:hypothetical protein
VLETARVRTLGIAAAAIVLAATAAVYWPGRTAGFVGDDFMILHRLRQLSGAADVLHFFRGEFFEYYRPLGFVLHAIDWFSAGPDPARFHLTNLALHLVSTLLVLLIGWRLSPGTVAAPIAAILFGLHASNHEAVMWISARFDLLATTMSLAAVYAAIAGGRSGRLVAGPLLFFLALLSKESAVALPLAFAGWLVFQKRAGRAEAIRELAPWLAALVLYAIVRRLGGGVSSIGGASRLPKLFAFGAALAIVALPGQAFWDSARAWLQTSRMRVAAGVALALALGALLCATSSGRAAQLAAEKLAVAGFAIFHLVSPVIDLWDQPFYLMPGTTAYWLGGVIAVGTATVVVLLLWRPMVEDDRLWFLSIMLVATLIPVSALTEGKRYLYLPSAAACLMAGVLVSRAPRIRAAVLIVGLICGVSVAQVSAKVQDWVWAGQMTAEGARLVDSALAPACGTGHVVFLTSPVAVRDVYTHFYYETFEPPRGCMPESFQVIARVMRHDVVVRAEWTAPSQIAITVPEYRGNFVLSQDLRTFDRPLDGLDAMDLATPAGKVRAERDGTALRLTLTLAPDLPTDTLFFYYSAGRIVAMEPPRAPGR